MAQAMKPGDLALIMGGMPADAAQKLTVKLANRLTLPQTTDAVAPVAVAPAPGPAATATPAAPVQTAAAAPTAAPAAAPAPAAPEKSDKPKS